MALTRNPSHKVGEFKGLDIILKSNNPTENYEEFMKKVEEFKNGFKGL